MRFKIYYKETVGAYILAYQNPGNPINDDQNACDEMIRHVTSLDIAIRALLCTQIYGYGDTFDRVLAITSYC